MVPSRLLRLELLFNAYNVDVEIYTMKPSEVASKLRQIAAAIEKSENPRKDLVAADLKRVIAAVSSPEKPTK